MKKYLRLPTKIETEIFENKFKIADEDTDGGFLLLTPKGAGSVNGSGEFCFNSLHI